MSHYMISHVSEACIVKNFPNLVAKKQFKLNFKSEMSQKPDGFVHATIPLSMLEHASHGYYDIKLDDSRKYDLYIGTPHMVKMSAYELSYLFDKERRAYLANNRNNQMNNAREDIDDDFLF